MKKICLSFLAVTFLLTSSVLGADLFKVIDKTYLRGTGFPGIISDNFIGSADIAKVVVINGGLQGSSGGRVSSAKIAVNGNIIFSQSDFNQTVDQLEKEINLIAGVNTLEVTLFGMPDGKINIIIYQPGIFIDASIGGTISTANMYGDVVTLEIPPNSLYQSNSIKMTVLDYPITSPIANIVFPGVNIEPHGLILKQPIKLKITLADTSYDNKLARIFYLKTPDLPLAIANQTITSNIIEGEIFHFSTYFSGVPSHDEIVMLQATLLKHKYPGIECIENINFIDDVYSMISFYGLHKALLLDDLANELMTALQGFVYEEGSKLLASPIPTNVSKECIKSTEYVINMVYKVLGDAGEDIINGFKDRMCDLNKNASPPVIISRVEVPRQGWGECPLVGKTYKLKTNAYDQYNNLIPDAEWKYINWTTSDETVGLLTEYVDANEWELSTVNVGKTKLTASTCGKSDWFAPIVLEFQICGKWNINENLTSRNCDYTDGLWYYEYIPIVMTFTETYDVIVRDGKDGFNVNEDDGSSHPMIVNNIFPGSSEYGFYYGMYSGTIFNNGTVTGSGRERVGGGACWDYPWYVPDIISPDGRVLWCLTCYVDGYFTGVKQ